MSNGLRCPECGSWYSTDPSVINSGMRIGDVCGNKSMKGTNPAKCSPRHPCKGILELAGNRTVDVLSDLEAIKAALEDVGDDDFDG